MSTFMAYEHYNVKTRLGDGVKHHLPDIFKKWPNAVKSSTLLKNIEKGPMRNIQYLLVVQHFFRYSLGVVPVLALKR